MRGRFCCLVSSPMSKLFLSPLPTEGKRWRWVVRNGGGMVSESSDISRSKCSMISSISNASLIPFFESFHSSFFFYRCTAGFGYNQYIVRALILLLPF